MPTGPDLEGVVADANAVGLPYVVIGGFSVIANGYVRAIKDSDLLVPGDPGVAETIVRFLDRMDATRMHDGKRLSLEDVDGVEHLRVVGRRGILAIMHGGEPPLDYETVAGYAESIDVGEQLAPVAALRSVVAFKRLAGRAQDKADLENLRTLYGELPIDPVPGLDD